jgi:hypothetical protein
LVAAGVDLVVEAGDAIGLLAAEGLCPDSPRYCYVANTDRCAWEVVRTCRGL